mmetsp:Transcript_37281/g.55777  ORF Transcript_37281/g.55777 Transcript_37281/m.55777 type:complete len:241 (-) Transcript_37281:40-762(-)
MNKLSQTGINTEATPDRYSYAAVLNAYSQSGLKDVGKKSLQILRMAFTGGNGGAGKHNRSNAKPLVDTVVYNAVLSALARSGERRSAQQADELLQQMEDDADADEEGLDTVPRPDISSYTSVIYAWANTETVEGAQRAEALLDRLVERYEYAVKERDNAISAVKNAASKIEKAEAQLKRKRYSNHWLEEDESTCKATFKGMESEIYLFLLFFLFLFLENQYLTISKQDYFHFFVWSASAL